jgi:hypothetical protein
MARISIKTDAPCYQPESRKRRSNGFALEIEVWMPTDVEAISPLIKQVIGLIERSLCVPGEEPKVELALREALNNAVVHGNRRDSRKRFTFAVVASWETGYLLPLQTKAKGLIRMASLIP